MTVFYTEAHRISKKPTGDSPQVHSRHAQGCAAVPGWCTLICVMACRTTCWPTRRRVAKRRRYTTSARTNASRGAFELITGIDPRQRSQAVGAEQPARPFGPDRRIIAASSVLPEFRQRWVDRRMSWPYVRTESLRRGRSGRLPVDCSARYEFAFGTRRRTWCSTTCAGSRSNGYPTSPDSIPTSSRKCFAGWRRADRRPEAVHQLVRNREASHATARVASNRLLNQSRPRSL